MVKSLWGAMRRRLIAAAVTAALTVLCWRCGVIGLLVARVLLPAVLPWAPSETVGVTGLSFGETPPPLERGVTVTISADRLCGLLRGGLRWARFLPPGLIRPGLVVRGYWAPDTFYLPPDGQMPVMIVVDSTTSRPAFRLRYPSDAVNRVMEQEVAEALRDRDEYILGTYETVYYIRFRTLRIRSEEPAPDGEKRRLRLEATGSVRFVLEENWFDLRNTGKIRILRGTADLLMGSDDRGIYASHVVNIDDLDINFNNMAPWLDRKLSAKLRKKWTKVLNKDKKRRRIERIRVPHWAPVDLDLDIELFPGNN